MAKHLFRPLRPQGDYARSLAMLRAARRIRPGQVTKSGLNQPTSSAASS